MGYRKESYRPRRPPACPANIGKSLTAWAPQLQAQLAPEASCTPLSPGRLRIRDSSEGLWLGQCWTKEMYGGKGFQYQPSPCQFRVLVRFHESEGNQLRLKVKGQDGTWCKI